MLYTVYAYYSCDYGNQKEGAFKESLGIFTNEYDAKDAAALFEEEEIAPNFLSCAIVEF